MKIGICGISGRMGQTILRIAESRGHQVVAAFDSEKSPLFGQNLSACGAQISADTKIVKVQDDFSEVDGIIDFSSPAATMNLLKICLAKRIPLVIGTTGFSDEQKAEIAVAGQEIPIMLSPNMSIGVNVLFKLTELASKALQEDYDVEVFEAHHKLKKDAPSGTARKLIDTIRENIPRLKDAPEANGRAGIVGERPEDEIGVMVMRGGDVAGEHTVFFQGMGERIELTHRATNRDIFAKGAVCALEFVSQSQPGNYSMYDVLGL